jgi:class 3 adenylate cyclase
VVQCASSTLSRPCARRLDEIVKADGRLFKAMGDALLAQFASPLNAVRFRCRLAAIHRPACAAS